MHLKQASNSPCISVTCESIIRMSISQLLMKAVSYHRIRLCKRGWLARDGPSMALSRLRLFMDWQLMTTDSLLKESDRAVMLRNLLTNRWSELSSIGLYCQSLVVNRVRQARAFARTGIRRSMKCRPLMGLKDTTVFSQVIRTAIMGAF